MKNIIFSLFILFSTVNISECVAEKKWPPLVFDQREGWDESAFPKKFRTSKDFENKKSSENESKDLNIDGLDRLNISGSAQFNVDQLANIKKKIKEIAPDNTFYVVDLREEAHFFIDGEPVTMFSQSFKDYWGVDSVRILSIESEMMTWLKGQKSWVVHDILQKRKDGKLGKSEQVNVTPELIQSEQDLSVQDGTKYFRLSVTDHHHPRPEVVDQFLSFVKTLPENAWLHFHCRGGSGRTSTFMLMYDMIRNTKNISKEDLFKRQIALGSKDLDAYENKKSLFRFEKSILRREFIHLFYDYLKDPNGYEKVTWTQWLQNKHLKTT